jgi:two-component system response regulator DevR
MIKIVIIDDSELVRMGLRALLAAESAFQIVGEAGSVATAADTVVTHTPNVVLLDIRLSDGTGFDACRQILQRAPETRVLFLTSVADDRLVEEAIRAGGHGYLLKEINGQGLIQAIRDVAAGKSFLDPTVTARVMSMAKDGQKFDSRQTTLASLSPQEHKVLALIAKGKTNKEVGNDLGLSEKTVKNYLANIFEKLNVSRRSQAAALYVENQHRV